MLLSLGVSVLSVASLVFGSPPFQPRENFSAANTAVAPLVNFQVAQPLTFPSNLKKCTVELIHHNFAASYYKPAIAEWSPPIGSCGKPESWAGVSLNYTATSNGTQYDRLSAVTFQNVEIWRTSTAEPSPSGIIWTALKDATHYLPLFAKPGRLILDLNNVLDESIGINGEYDVTFSVTVYTHPKGRASGVKTSDLIVPLSNMSPDQPNYVAIPPALNTIVKLPRNAAEAYAEIYASGNSQEEFWYFNAANSWLPSLPADTTYGQGPFREVRLLVDGMLAGFATPYPVLFTGAWQPLVWRPVSAYGSFDQPTYKVDLTPFVPLLADGKEHNVTIDVVSAEPDHAVLSNWWVSGNIQVILDKSSRQTTGKITKYIAPAYASTTTTGVSTDGGADVNITVTAKHDLYIESEVVTGSGRKSVSWSQRFKYDNLQSYLDNANVQIVNQHVTGSSLSTHNGVPKIRDDYSYPLTVDFWWITEGGSGYGTTFDHAYNRAEVSPLITGSSIQTRRYSEGTRVTPPGGPRVSTAYSTQKFAYKDAAGNTYTRAVKSVNGTVSEDTQGGSLASVAVADWTDSSAVAIDFEGLARKQGVKV